MQTGSEQLKRQQLVLKLKGFYHGAIDGIWSAMTIAAKTKWERSRNFVPALPNNGLPFAGTGPYPAGVRTGKDGLLTCPELEEYFAAEKETADRALVSKTVQANKKAGQEEE